MPLARYPVPHRNPLATLALAVVLASCPAVVTASDEIVLKNGSRIVGKVKAVRDGVVTVKTDFAGDIAIRQDQVDSIRSALPAVLKLADGEVVEVPALVVEEQQLVLAPATGPSAYTVQDVLLSNPQAWELGQGYRWTGNLSAALKMQRGNTDSDELDYRFDSVWRSLRNRYTLRLDGEIDKANDDKIAENWAALAKYDHFLQGPWYVGVNVSAEQDKFADLDLRYYLGPYLGRQFFDTPVLKLSAEAGLVYVEEQFILAEDDDYLGANWTVDASSNYLGGDSRLYLKHTGIWNLDQTDDYILNLTLGLSFPLLFNIEGAAEIQLEYDGGLPREVEKLDQTYRFRMGYSW